MHANTFPLGTVVAALVVHLATLAAAQPPAAGDGVARWLEQHDKPGAVLPAAEGRAALARLPEWLSAAGSNPTRLALVRRAQIVAALAAGDVAQAVRELEPLTGSGDDLDSVRLMWLTGVAAGDAQRAAQALEKIRAQQGAAEERIAARRARLKAVARPAPDVELTPTDGPAVPLRKHPGHALVLEFWSSAGKPADAQRRAVAALAAELKTLATARLVGLNADPAPAALDAARQSGGERHWPQVIDPAAVASLQKELGLAELPALVLIDQHGTVRAVGGPGDPEFVYAVRAAAAEAAGTFTAIQPKDLAGTPARPVVASEPPRTGAVRGRAPAGTGERQPEPAGQDEAGGRKPDPDETKPAADLPHNPEAKSMLDQARVYMKTGRKSDARKLLEEIIAKYPNTAEAKDAREWLDVLSR